MSADDPKFGEPTYWQPPATGAPLPPQKAVALFGDFAVADHTATKRDLSQRAVALVNAALETTDAADLFLALKQMEHVIDEAVDTVKRQAFDAFGRHLGGATAGVYAGNKVTVTYPMKTIETPAVAAMKARHKLELDALRAQELRDGISTKEPGKGVVSITLKP